MYIEDGAGTELGEVRQRWHPFKRNYDIYINKQQFASISGTFLAWEFELKNAEGGTLALIDRNFQGFGRELFTDAGKYAIHFGSNTPQAPEGHEASIPSSSALPQPALHTSPTEHRQEIEASSSAQQLPQHAQANESSSVYQQQQPQQPQEQASVYQPPQQPQQQASVHQQPQQLQQQASVYQQPQQQASVHQHQQQQQASSSGYPVTPMAQARTDVSTIPTATGNELVVARSLQLEERMAVLAAAISIDYDYFSHHSHSSGWFGMWPMMVPYPGGGAPTEAGRETGDAGPAGGVGGVGGAGAAGAGSETAAGGPSASGAGPDTRSGLESELGNDDAFPSGGFDKGGDGEMQWDLPQSGEGGAEGGGGGILGTLWDLLGGGD
ncbi:Scramblase-domain-containing protein [Dunaliella salina]|nr:Scramblase-domain-containing protein [Dunaliella salina]|eukprot:KAF5835974.1 Scramblase-domain-containing protein [Dunaliella salina]